MTLHVLLTKDGIPAWIGAAPRQRGSSEAWMLRQPCVGISSTACGRIRP